MKVSDILLAEMESQNLPPEFLDPYKKVLRDIEEALGVSFRHKKFYRSEYTDVVSTAVGEEGGVFDNIRGTIQHKRGSVSMSFVIKYPRMNVRDPKIEQLIDVMSDHGFMSNLGDGERSFVKDMGHVDPSKANTYPDAEPHDNQTPAARAYNNRLSQASNREHIGGDASNYRRSNF